MVRRMELVRNKTMRLPYLGRRGLSASMLDSRVSELE